MKITLYKNCIFTRSYSEVCDCRIKDTNGKTARDRYLESLTSEVYEIDGVYSTNTGTINIPITLPNSGSNVYDFNYAKIEFENITRFCFIDDIQFRNYIAIIFYSEDIWHSYSGDMNFRKGLLTNALHFSYGRNGRTLLKNLFSPAEYIARGQYELPEKFTNFVVFAQLQKYKLSADVSTRRETFACILASWSSKTPAENAYYFTSFDEAVNNARSWVANAGIAKLTNDWYYEIDNFTIIPYDYVSDYGIPNIVEGGTPLFLFTDPDDTARPEKLAISIKYGYNKIKEFIAGSGIYKRIGIGTMNATYETVETNTSYRYSLNLYSDSTDVKLLLNLQGKIIDITDNFIFEIPFTSITGDVTAQRKLARSMETVNGVRQVIGGVTKVATSIASAVITGGASEATAVAGKATANRLINSYHYTRRSVEYKNAMAKVAGAEARSAMAGAEATGGIVGGVDSIVGGIQGIISANSPIYISQKGTFVQGNKGLSCQYGIFEKIPIVDNETEVNNLIKEIGYQTNQIVNNDIFLPFNSTYDYNILKFGSVILFGKFPQSVCEDLKTILMNGTKIWYVESGI